MDLPSSTAHPPESSREFTAMAEPTSTPCINSSPSLPSRSAYTKTGGGTPKTGLASPTKNPGKRKASVHFDESTILSNSPATKKNNPLRVKNIAIPRRKPPTRANRALPIPRSYEECEAHDKALVNMRDAGKPWPEIAKEWEHLMGEKTGKSTLPNRYIRLKANFTSIKDEDKATLIIAKQEIEDEMAMEKWKRVADKMAEKGTRNYQPEELYIQWKKMMLSAEYLPAARDNAQRKSRFQQSVDEAVEEAE